MPDPVDPDEDFVDVTLRDSIRTSIVRTVTPILVGFLALALLRLGIKLDDATLSTAISSLIAGLYYSALRYLEPRYPWLGKFLGKAKPPIYDTVDGQLQTRMDQLAHMIRQDNINRRSLLLPESFKGGTSYPDDAPLFQPPTVPGILHEIHSTSPTPPPFPGISFPSTPKD